MIEIVDKQVQELKKLWRNKRQLAFQGLNLAMIVLSALMIWKSLMVVTKSESPVVVVLRLVFLYCVDICFFGSRTVLQWQRRDRSWCTSGVRVCGERSVRHVL